MYETIYVALIVAAFIAVWSAALLAKRIGDELAGWVISHDEDESVHSEFGVETRTFAGGRSRWPSLKAYRPYVARYRELRTARGEDVLLARRFELIALSRWIVIAVPIVFLLVGLLLGEFPIKGH